MARNPHGAGMRPREWRGRWRAYLTLGYDDLGKPRRKWVYGRTEGECLAKLQAAQADKSRGALPTDGRIAMPQYLDEWLALRGREVRDSTLRSYASRLKLVRARCGRARLGDLQPLQVQRWIEGIADDVSPSSARQVRALLIQALEDAVRFGLVQRNAARATRAPRVERAAPEVWTAEEVSTFLRTTGAGAHYHALFYVALTTGLRPGELLALEWGDVTRNAIRVERTVALANTRTVGAPKTPSSRRTVPLPADARQVLDVQRTVARGSVVFPNGRGQQPRHQNYGRSLATWAARAGVRATLTPHGLRHTYASMAIAQGMDVAELARRLGHANASITLSTYVHFFERRDRRPTPSLADLLGAVGGTTGGISASQAN